MLQYHERVRITWSGILIGMILSYLIASWWPNTPSPMIQNPPCVPIPSVSSPTPTTPVDPIAVRVPSDPFYDRWN